MTKKNKSFAIDIECVDYEFGSDWKEYKRFATAKQRDDALKTLKKKLHHNAPSYRARDLK